MKKNIYYLFTALSFSLLMAAPGRLAFGIVICAEFFFLLFAGWFFEKVTEYFNLVSIRSAVSVTTIIFATLFYKALITIMFPLVALQLSYVFYLPAVSSFIIGTIANQGNIEQSEKYKSNFKATLAFSVFALILYFFRDLLCYGTLTMPSKTGLAVKTVIERERTGFLTFFASIPGTLVIIACTILLFIFIQNKFEIIERAQVNSVESNGAQNGNE